MLEQMAVANADDVAAALVQELGPMDAMKLQKLLYYAQAWHLAITDRPLFNEAIQAWRDGPVVPPIFKQHRGERFVSEWLSGDPSHLGSEACQLLTLVAVSYGHMSGDDLSVLTHAEEPWLEAREDLPAGFGSQRLISHDSLKRFFRGKELAGRLSADLAAGGLCLGDTSTSAEALSGELDKIRASFHGEPDNHPDDTHGSNSVSRHGANPEIAASLAKRLAARRATT